MGQHESHYIAFIVSLLVLLCLSAFFSSCEMAFSSLNRIKLKGLAAKSRRARLALKLLEVYDKILSTVLIGNNVVNITASALATALCISLLGAKGVSIATIVMTILLLVLGDISPKTLAKESPEVTAIRNAPLLRFFIFIFTPINYFTAVWKKLIMFIFPARHDRSTTEDELLTFVGEVAQEGGINKQEEKMIRQVIEFDEITAAEIFTPRVDVIAVSQTTETGEIDRKFADTGFSRLPVFRDNIDNIFGVILLKDFYYEVIKNKKTVAEIVKSVVFVTKTIKIAKLLQTLQKKKAHLAVVVDEYGGTLGIITIEDIVEELVGEIWDEHDKVVEPVKKVDDNSFIVRGSTNFRDMLDFIATGVKIDEIPGTTVGNWIMENQGRLPNVGEEFFWHNLKIKVSGILRHRVMEVIVSINSGEDHGKE